MEKEISLESIMEVIRKELCDLNQHCIQDHKNVIDKQITYESKEVKNNDSIEVIIGKIRTEVLNREQEAAENSSLFKWKTKSSSQNYISGNRFKPRNRANEIRYNPAIEKIALKITSRIQGYNFIYTIYKVLARGVKLFLKPIDKPG